jgi:prophage regulatory protein
METNIEAGTRILREPDVRRLTGVSRGTRWRWEKDGKFPQRVRLGRNLMGWREHEILQWIESRPRGFSV